MGSYSYITETGTILPDAATIRTDVENEWKDVFGQDLNVDPETPQGMLIDAEVESRISVARNNATLANQNNPNLSGGVFVDSNLAQVGAERKAAGYSTTVETITGVASTVISEGFQVQHSTSGAIFATVADTVIGVNGTVDVVVQALEAGPIGAAVGTLTVIVSNVLGVETVTNAVTATLGTTEQTDPSAKNYRVNVIFGQGSAMAKAVMGNVFKVANVTSVSYRENYSDDTIVYQGVTLVPHSIFVCVDGGISADIALAIQEKKNQGTGYNGAVTVEITDPNSGQIYDVKFSRPTEIPILAQVTVQQNIAVVDIVTTVKQAILDYAAGLIEGQEGFKINKEVSVFELSAAIGIKAPNLFIGQVLISLASPVSFSVDPIPVLIDQIATIDEGSISVTVL